MVDQFIASFTAPLLTITPDLDAVDDKTHGSLLQYETSEAISKTMLYRFAKISSRSLREFAEK